MSKWTFLILFSPLSDAIVVGSFDAIAQLAKRSPGMLAIEICSPVDRDWPTSFDSLPGKYSVKGVCDNGPQIWQ